MRNVWIILKRELGGYFATPIAYVFLAIFVFLAGIFTFYLGNFFERGYADLQAFFLFHPWLYMFLIPALSMRLWAEERRGGTIELLLTLPVTMTQAVPASLHSTHWLKSGMEGLRPFSNAVIVSSSCCLSIGQPRSS